MRSIEQIMANNPVLKDLQIQGKLNDGGYAIIDMPAEPLPPPPPQPTKQELAEAKRARRRARNLSNLGK